MPNGDPCRGVVKTLAAPLEFLNAEFDGDPRGEVVKTLAAPLEFLKAEFGGDPRRGVVETLGGEMCVITGQGSHQSRVTVLCLLLEYGMSAYLTSVRRWRRWQ
ncbi:hypothetical protein BVRB_8g191560 isoform B [Beta vulgaris subsp. vulgaris]|nr:hypothetical protein BVRB_8g191560 isoform B [Beta vulgaris subsp. vulgaris]